MAGYWAAVAAPAVVVLALVPRHWLDGLSGIVVGSAPFVASALVVNWVMVRRGWTDWYSLGWQPSGGRVGESWGVGTALGVVLATLALLVILAGGGGASLTGESLGAYAGRAGVIVAVLLLAALSEELLFRGYPLARLSKAIGPIGASITLAVGFAMIHLGNPDVTPYGLGNIALASLVLSAAFFTRGAMLAAWGVHFGWNAGLALLADAPVSGIALHLPLLEYHAGRPDWLTGGSFGPEGGLAATGAMLAGLVLLIGVLRRQAVEAAA